MEFCTEDLFLENTLKRIKRGQETSIKNRKHPKFRDYTQFVLINFIIPPPKFFEFATACSTFWCNTANTIKGLIDLTLGN